MTPSLKQRKELARTLKTFAFEQSPMFAKNEIQAMKVAQTFEYVNQPSLPEELREIVLSDRVIIELGFYAARFTRQGSTPIYSYEVKTVGSQSILPRELKKRLSSDGWADLYNKYGDDESVYKPEEEDDDEVSTIVKDTMQDDVIDNLMEAGIDSEVYQRQMLTFASCEDAIESSYERGLSIDSGLYDVLSTHDMLDPDWDYIDTPEGPLYIPHRYKNQDTALDIGDEVETFMGFEEIMKDDDIRSRPSIDLLPHDVKLREMLYTIECLRQRRILDR